MVARQISLIARPLGRAHGRQPGVWIPPLLFPLMLMAVNSNGLQAATHLPGLPDHSFLAFFLPFSFMQGALFASGIAGTDLARDIDTGFLNRLALTPVRGSALLLGQIGGALGIGVVQALVYLARRAGRRRAHRQRASAGALLILVLALLIAVGFGDARALDRAAHRLGRRRAVAVPAALLPALHLEHEPAAQPDRGRLVPRPRDDQPGQLHDRGAALARDRGLERAGARARLRLHVRADRASRCGSPARQLKVRMART